VRLLAERAQIRVVRRQNLHDFRHRSELPVELFDLRPRPAGVRRGVLPEAGVFVAEVGAHPLVLARLAGVAEVLVRERVGLLLEAMDRAILVVQHLGPGWHASGTRDTGAKAHACQPPQRHARTHTRARARAERSI